MIALVLHGEVAEDVPSSLFRLLALSAASASCFVSTLPLSLFGSDGYLNERREMVRGKFGSVKLLAMADATAGSPEMAPE